MVAAERNRCAARASSMATFITEQYFGEMTPRTPHLLWSSSKAFLGMVAARYLHDGTIDEQDGDALRRRCWSRQG